ncbi:MAG: CehA/McbA family metallohydrolase [Polyangiaceae bacterium]
MRSALRRSTAAVVLAGAACGDGAATQPAPVASAPAPVDPSASAPPRDAAPADAGTDVVFEIRDAATKAPMPGKLTFVGVDGTASPLFTTSDVALEQDRSMRAFNRVMTLSGDGRLQIPKGRYDVYVTRGPAWSMHLERGLELGGKEVTIEAELTREIDTTGWISGDFHVHAERSFDSKVPMRARVYEFIAEGVDLLVATDHNAVADYAPIIRELGVDDRIASLRGDEITTRDWGHFGTFPLDEGATAFPAKGRTPAAIFADVREHAPKALIDVNHPRFDRGLGYFRTGIFDRTQAKFGRSGASLDFDAVEVLNGYEGSSPVQVDEVMKDWFALIAHGYLVTAMGNSDTHHLDASLAGYPRNFIPVRAAVGSPALAGEVVEAIRGKRSFLTTAPFVAATVGGATIGDTVRAVEGRVTVHVRVRAASWVGLDALSIYAGGAVVATRPLSGRDPLRFDDDITVDAPGDTFVVARVEGKEPLPLVVGDGAKYVAYPLAVTNPIWIDGDGDGRFTPPSGR